MIDRPHTAKSEEIDLIVEALNTITKLAKMRGMLRSYDWWHESFQSVAEELISGFYERRVLYYWTENAVYVPILYRDEPAFIEFSFDEKKWSWRLIDMKHERFATLLTMFELDDVPLKPILNLVG